MIMSKIVITASEMRCPRRREVKLMSFILTLNY